MQGCEDSNHRTVRKPLLLQESQGVMLPSHSSSVPGSTLGLGYCVELSLFAVCLSNEHNAAFLGGKMHMHFLGL